MRSLVRAAGPLLAGVAWLLLAPVPSASADDVTSASWTELRQSTALGATPDLQSTDGHALPVASTPLGAVAMAAVRTSHAAATLELTRVDPASGVPLSSLPVTLPLPAPIVWACPATGAWSTGDRQPWSTKPTYSCARHAVGSASAAGMFWDLSALGQSAVNIVLVPAEGGTNAFDLAFAAPTSAAFQTTDDGPASSPVDLGGGLPMSEPPASGGIAGTGSGGLIGAGSPSVPGTISLPTQAAGPPLIATAPAGTAPTTSHALPVSSAGAAAPRWLGAALLAFLALLLMVKAAVPTGAVAAPRTLVTVKPEREND